MYKKKYYIRAFSLIFIAFFLSSYLSAASAEKNAPSSVRSAQSKIDDFDRSWFAVLTGSPSRAPVQTAYGFLVVQEERLLACYLKNGHLFWNTNILSKIKYITVSDSDFIYVVTEKNQLVSLNPSGKILWKSNLPFAAQSEPLVCFDGRIVVRGKNALACYGVGGSLKWNVKTEPLRNLPLQNLNDGSVLVFLERLSGGKTCALRFNPFGTVIEEIVFQGAVSGCFASQYGVGLIFSGGDIGMCSVSEKKEKVSGTAESVFQTESRWVNKTLSLGESTLVKKKNDFQFIFFSNGTVHCVDVSDGTCCGSFSVQNINAHDVSILETVDGKVVIADSVSCVVYDSDGTQVSCLLLPEKKGKYKWDYAFFIDSGFIAFLSSNWMMHAFKIVSTSKEKDGDFFKEYAKKSPVKNDPFIRRLGYRPSSAAFSDEAYAVLKNENYAQKESKIADDIFTVISLYLYDKNSAEINRGMFNPVETEYSVVDMEKVIRMIPIFESAVFQQTFAELLHSETDRTLIMKLLDGIAACGYDPCGEILSEIERLIKRTSPKEKAVLQKAVDAMYEICRFMGKPAFISRGKQILSNLFYPQYDESVKKTVRSCMQKLADLGM